ncbi:hypothetical protein GCM10009779_31680 [Polymorphospora rubra]
MASQADAATASSTTTHAAACRGPDGDLPKTFMVDILGRPDRSAKVRPGGTARFRDPPPAAVPGTCQSHSPVDPPALLR